MSTAVLCIVTLNMNRIGPLESEGNKSSQNSTMPSESWENERSLLVSYTVQNDSACFSFREYYYFRDDLLAQRGVLPVLLPQHIVSFIMPLKRYVMYSLPRLDIIRWVVGKRRAHATLVCRRAIAFHECVSGLVYVNVLSQYVAVGANSEIKEQFNSPEFMRSLCLLSK